MFPPLSLGASKLGPDTKLTTPVVALIVNFPASVPPRLYVTVPPAGSVAAAVYAVVAFSATLAVPPELNVGATFVTPTVTAFVLVSEPSEAG